MNIFEQNIMLPSYISPDVNKYSVWVYDGGDIISVYKEETPNTVEIWMEFHTFTYIYWRMMENECIDNIHYSIFYNYSRIKMFMIRYLFAGTNFPGVFTEYDKYGRLTDRSYESVMRIHPRILRSIFDKVRFFPDVMPENEKQILEKQCQRLFGKGEAVENPHKDVVTYCNLTSFWEKFGLNYFDIMKLPQDLFSSLRYIMMLDNQYKSQALESNKSTGGKATAPPARRRR